jgi:hypothetical protein
LRSVVILVSMRGPTFANFFILNSVSRSCYGSSAEAAVICLYAWLSSVALFVLILIVRFVCGML